MPKIRVPMDVIQKAHEWGERVVLARLGFDLSRPYLRLPIDTVGNGVEEIEFQQLDGSEQGSECIEAGLLGAMSNKDE